jgi:hypothetical protein
MRGATYGLKALSQPSGIFSSVAACEGDAGSRDSERMGRCAARLATVVVRSFGETWYNMLPLLSRRVTVDSREFVVSIEKAGTPAPRTLEAPPIRSALCIRSTAVDGSGGRVVCASPPSRKLTPAHAHDATAHSPADAGERVNDLALGAASGALFGGPIGLVAGGVIGYVAGPDISRG